MPGFCHVLRLRCSNGRTRSNGVVLSAVEACPGCSRKGLRANGKGRGQSASGNGTGPSWPRARRRGSGTRVAASPAVRAPVCPKNATLRPMIGTTAPWPCQGFENEQGFLCSAGWHPACCKSSVRDGRKKGKRTGYRFCRSNTERSGGFYSGS